MAKMTIIQPGRIGDIVIALPIAYHFHKEGYNIIWPTCQEYTHIFNYIDFPIQNINLGKFSYPALKIKREAEKYINGQYIDLGIGWGDSVLDRRWKESNLPFDIWKYNEAKISFQKKYELKKFFKRNIKKELLLLEKLGIVNDDKYIVLHEQGSNGRSFKFPTPLPYPDTYRIDIEPIEGYTVFDWICAIENAEALYCVDSCVANIIDQLGIEPKGDKFFHKWTEYYTQTQLHLLTPKISDDWVFI